MQPGEEQRVAMFSGLQVRPLHAGTATAREEIPAKKEEILGYELTAVLFADGTFYGPDDIGRLLQGNRYYPKSAR